MASNVLAQLKVMLGLDATKLHSGLNEASISSAKSARKIESSLHGIGTTVERLIGPLSATGRQISVAFDAIGASAAEASKAASGLGLALSVAGGAAAAAILGLAGATMKIFSDLEQTVHAAEGVGMGVAQYTELTEALKVFQINQEQANQALAYFDKILSGLVRSKAGATAIKELGLNMAELQKMTPHDALLAIADAFSKLQNGTMKAGIAAALFENTYGIKLIPFLNQGRAGIEKLEDRFKSLGEATEKNAGAVESLEVAWQQFKSAVEAGVLETSAFVGIPGFLLAIAHPLDTLTAIAYDFGSAFVGVLGHVTEAVRWLYDEINKGAAILHLPQIDTSALNSNAKLLAGYSAELAHARDEAIKAANASPLKGGGGGGSVLPIIPGAKKTVDKDALEWQRAQNELLKARAKAEGEYNTVLLTLQGSINKTDAETKTYHETMAKLNAEELQGVDVTKGRILAEKQFAAAIEATNAAILGTFKMPEKMPGGWRPGSSQNRQLTLAQIAALPGQSPDSSLAVARAMAKESELSANSFAKLASAFPNLTEAEVAALPAGQKMIDYLTHLEKHGRQAMETLRSLREELIAEGNDLRGNLVSSLSEGIRQAEGEMTRLLTGQRFNFLGVLQNMGQSVIGSFLQKGVGSILGKFGLSASKPDGTSSNPLYVTPVDRAGNVVGSLGGVMGGIVPTFPGSGKGSVFDGLESRLGGLLKIAGGGILGAFGKIGSIFGGFLAGGGDVTPGRAYIVGEKHPELFVPGASGRVVPSIQTGPGKSPMVYNATYMINTPNADSFRKSQAQLISEGYRHMATVHARNS